MAWAKGARGRRLPTALARDKWDALVDGAAGGEAGRRWDEIAVRDQAVVSLFLFSGLRSNELAGLTVGQVDWNAGTIRLIGKGNKERIAAVGGDALEYLEAYLELRPDADDAGEIPDTAPLFRSRKGGHLTNSQVRRLVKAAGQAAGLDGTGHGRQRIHPHLLRAAHATQLHAKGADLVTIADQLGHEDLGTTRRYLAISVEKRRDQVRDM